MFIRNRFNILGAIFLITIVVLAVNTFADESANMDTKQSRAFIRHGVSEKGILATAWDSIDRAHEFACDPLWNLRGNLEEKGLTTEIYFTGDFLRNTQGGIDERTTFLSALDFTLTLDTEKAGFWKGGKFYAYMNASHSEKKPTDEIIGDAQYLDNIEAARNVRLMELWYEHTFSQGKYALLVGQHDVNTDFAKSDYGALYINSSFGFLPTLSLNGRPSVYPVTTLGTRFKYTPNENWDFLFGVYDGDPGAAEVNRANTRWILAHDQGAFLITEAQYHWLGNDKILPGTYKIGFWNNTGEFEDLVDVDDEEDGEALIRTNNLGGYFIADQMLYKEKDTEDQGLGTFVVLGGAPDHINTYEFYVGGGMNYKGLLPKRDADTLGFGISQVFISDEIRQEGLRDDRETTLEATYRIEVSPWFVIQPDLQYVFDPGANPDYKDALIAIFRFEISL